MGQSQPPDNEQRPTIGADAVTAGAGSGTLLVLLANNLPDGHWARSWLVTLAPSVTMGIGYVWIRLRFLVDDWFAQRGAQVTFDQARKTLRAILADPDISEEHKARTRKALEDLEADFIRNTTSRFRARVRIKD